MDDTCVIFIIEIYFLQCLVAFLPHTVQLEAAFSHPQASNYDVFRPKNSPLISKFPVINLFTEYRGRFILNL